MANEYSDEYSDDDIEEGPSDPDVSHLIDLLLEKKFDDLKSHMDTTGVTLETESDGKSGIKCLRNSQLLLQHECGYLFSVDDFAKMIELGIYDSNDVKNFINFGSSAMDEKVMSYLFKQLHPDSIKNYSDPEYGVTPVHTLFYSHFYIPDLYDLIKYAVETCEFNPNKTTNYGQTIIELTISQKEGNILEYLLSIGCDPCIFEPRISQNMIDPLSKIIYCTKYYDPQSLDNFAQCFISIAKILKADGRYDFTYTNTSGKTTRDHILISKPEIRDVILPLYDDVLAS